MNEEVIIIGGGLSGLSAAVSLHQAGIPFELVEAESEFGGRVRTDKVDGFSLDRGFQVLLTAYPDAQRLFDYESLELGEFFPGALIMKQGQPHRVADPFRRPLEGLKSVFDPIGSFADKWRVAKLRRKLMHSDASDSLWSAPNSTTREALTDEYGFSDQFVREFFEPFIGGVTLDANLSSSRRFFDFVYRMFATGHAALPAGGMQRLPEQLADQLPDDQISTETKVETVTETKNGVDVRFANRPPQSNSAAVLAVPHWDLPALLPGVDVGSKSRPSKGVVNVYFRAQHSPVDDPILVLNGDGHGPINNLVVPSDIASGYAPGGEALISISVLESDRRSPQPLTSRIRRQAREWFGPEVDDWSHLKTYHIQRALPDQSPEFMQPVEKDVVVGKHLLVAGDHQETASIQGALAAGRRAADHLRDTSTNRTDTVPAR